MPKFYKHIVTMNTNVEERPTEEFLASNNFFNVNSLVLYQKVNNEIKEDILFRWYRIGKGLPVSPPTRTCRDCKKTYEGDYLSHLCTEGLTFPTLDLQ